MSDPVLSVTDSAEWDRVRAVIAANVYATVNGERRAQIVTEALLGPRPADPPPEWENDGGRVRVAVGGMKDAVRVEIDYGTYVLVDASLARAMARALVACADWIDKNRSADA